MPSSTHDGSAGLDLSGTVVVTLGDRAATKAGDHVALVALVARLTGVEAASVSLSQVCPNCGETGHGPLRVWLSGDTDASPTVHVSLARAAGRLALAVTTAGPVGIDLESVSDVARASVAAVLLSPTETDAMRALPGGATEVALADLWTAKEAVLKAAGVGLRVDPRDLTITLGTVAATAGAGDGAAHSRLAAWRESPFPLAELHLLPVPTPPGFMATVAIVCGGQPHLRVVRARP